MSSDLSFFIENKKLIKSYNLKVIKGREYFCKELRKKKYLINNGNGLSILIFMRSNTNLKKKYNILLKNKIYTKIVDIGFKKFITDTNVVKISVVGNAMRTQSGIAKTMFETLASNQINIHVISTSEIKISVLISSDYYELAMRSLHSAFGLDV